MIRFDTGEVRVPNDGEVDILGRIYEDDCFVSEMTLVREGSQFVIDCAFESLVFPTIQKGKAVDENFIKEKRDSVWRSIQRAREAA